MFLVRTDDVATSLTISFFFFSDKTLLAAIYVTDFIFEVWQKPN